MVRHQLLIPNCGRKRTPNLRVSDRIIAGCAPFSCLFVAGGRWATEIDIATVDIRNYPSEFVVFALGCGCN